MKLTINDFLDRHYLCVNCNDFCQLYFVTELKFSGKRNRISAKLTNKNILLIIKNSYFKTTSLKLNLVKNTNKFSIININDFKSYIESHDINLLLICNRCKSQIETSNLEFNINNNYLNAFDLRSQYIVLNNKNILYMIYTYYYNNFSIVKVIDPNIDSTRITSELKIPILPNIKYTKNTLLNKIKSYILFS